MQARPDQPAGRVTLRHGAQGAIYIRALQAADAYPRCITQDIARRAGEHPDRLCLAERREGEWVSLSWGEMYRKIQSIGQALLHQGADLERPVAILSANSISHMLLAVAANHIGLPYSPLSPGWSLLSQDFDRLDAALKLLTPSVIYVEDKAAFAPALQLASARQALVIDRADLELWAQTPVSDAVQRAHARLQGKDVSRILFTSGSTGQPKGVINTQQMVCANAAIITQVFPALADAPEIISWLPAHHTSGANVILSTMLLNGGSLYIDDGRPLPQAMEATLRNLRGRQPRAYFSAPSGFDLLADGFEADPDFARDFLGRLEFFFYSGASLAQPIAERMGRLTKALVGREIPFYSCYGATELSPFALVVDWPQAGAGLAGVPMPGVEVKLAPAAGLYEARFRGDCVTPGYWRNSAATDQAFDDEGFYKSGDAMSLVDPQHPDCGLRFDGRIGENFKLATGTWINVSGLREMLLQEAGGLIREAVIVGEGQANAGALIYLAQERDDDRAALAQILQRMAAKSTGSSTFVERVKVLRRPPDAAAGELTDKGSIANRQFRHNRAAEIEALFATPLAPDVIRAAVS